MTDQRGQLLRAALGFAGCSMPSYDRRALLGSLGLSVLVASLAAEAQTATKALIGVLMLPPRAGAGGIYIQALREGLRDLGYVVEGQHVLLRAREGRGPERRSRYVRRPWVSLDG